MKRRSTFHVPCSIFHHPSLKLRRASVPCFLLLVSCFIFLISCTPKNGGFITLVNSNVEKMDVSIDGRSFTLFPSNHITKEVSAGKHELSYGDKVQSVDVVKDITTVFDSSGLACYVVVDFSQRFRGGNPTIAQKFQQQQIFTTRDKMAVVLGQPLPSKPPANDQSVLRLHQVDCGLIDDNVALITELANAP